MSLRELLLQRTFPPVEQTLSWKDTVLYALGVGLGQEIDDPRRLRFVYEDGLLALPTMPVVLGSAGFWHRDPELGLDWKRILHGEQAIEIHGSIPAEGTVVGQTTILDIIDKGPAKGLFIVSENRLTDKESGQPIATLRSTSVCRGDGGRGGSGGSLPAPHAIPDRAPDMSWSFKTEEQAALIYRLSGDTNPLHVDPEIAGTAGFDKPILHGLCTLGIAGHALLRMLCDYDPSRLTGLALRFSSPVYPGETIRTDIWRDGDTASFRCVVAERGIVAINNGQAQIAPAAIGQAA